MGVTWGNALAGLSVWMNKRRYMPEQVFCPYSNRLNRCVSRRDRRHQFRSLLEHAPPKSEHLCAYAREGSLLTGLRVSILGGAFSQIGIPRIIIAVSFLYQTVISELSALSNS